MPLSAKARVELYIPDQPESLYQDLLSSVKAEFTTVFGGCSVARISGSYTLDSGESVTEEVFVVYTDTDFDLESNREELGRYANGLRKDVYEALEEEDILVAVLPVYHSV